jgi:hypothetical protein
MSKKKIEPIERTIGKPFIGKIPSALDKLIPLELIEKSFYTKDYDPVSAATTINEYFSNPDNLKIDNRIKKEEPKLVIKCPVCKSKNISDNSTYENNGVLGPGYHSYKTSDSRSCNKCGVIFKLVKGNGL